MIAQFDNMLASINNGDLAIPGEKSDMYDAIADIYTIRGFLEKSLGVKRDYGDPQGQGVFPC